MRWWWLCRHVIKSPALSSFRGDLYHQEACGRSGPHRYYSQWMAVLRHRDGGLGFEFFERDGIDGAPARHIVEPCLVFLGRCKCIFCHSTCHELYLPYMNLFFVWFFSQTINQAQFWHDVAWFWPHHHAKVTISPRVMRKSVSFPSFYFLTHFLFQLVRATDTTRTSCHLLLFRVVLWCLACKPCHIYPHP